MRFRGTSLAVACTVALLAVGSARAGISAVAVQPSASSVRISWLSDRPVRAVVELGLDASYGIWSPIVTGSGLDVSIGGLGPNTGYRFRIRTPGQQLAGAFRTQAPAASPRATVAGETILVDGQPFFPRMVWGQCPSGVGPSLAAGINLFMGAGCGTGAPQVVGRAYGVVDAHNTGAAPAGTIGFYQPDEADEHGGLDALVPLPPASQSGRVSFLTFTNHFFSGAEPLAQGRAMYKPMAARADVVGFDLYPLAIWCRRRYAAVADAQRELEALAPDKPTFQWIEAGTMTGCSRFVPTPESVEAETWLAIAAGARGIGYFPDTWAPDIGARIAAVNRRITALAPALLAPERSVAAAPSSLRAGARLLAGATYVIAVNSSSRLTAKARITLPGFTGRSIGIYGEARSLPVRNGVFGDVLAPLQARIYVAPPPGAP